MSPAPERAEDGPIRVAVIGSGLAGLVTAYSLQTLDARRLDGTPIEFEVELFEKSDALGMDSNSISVELGDSSAPFRIDSPMRSINGGSHSRLFQLYKHLDIALRRSDFSYSFSRLTRPDSSASNRPCSPSPPPPYSHENDKPTDVSVRNETLASPPPQPQQHTQFLYEGSNGLMFPPLAFPSTVSRASLLAQVAYVFDLALLALSYLHLLLLAFIYSWLGLTSRALPTRTRRARLATFLGLRAVADESVDDFCRRHYVAKRMKDEVLVPLYAAVSTVGRNEARDMPIAECLDYIVSTFGASHYVADVGVQQVVRRLVAPLPLDRVQLSSTITSITSSPSTSLIQLTLSKASPPRPFNHVIFATQANQAAPLLPSTPSLAPVHSALQTWNYVRTLVVNHTDSSILPPLARDRRDLNLVSFASPRSSSEHKRDENDLGTDAMLGAASIQATHILSRTHARLMSGVELFQTTNPIVEIDESEILSKAWYERAVVSKASKKVLGGFLMGEDGEGHLQGVENMWFVGSWCAEGIPLLEGCVTSSERVVRELVKRHGGDEVHLDW